jgi:molybdopterin-guanine dinucleotide biosynthesis protein
MPSMVILAVSGACSRSGKTALAETLLRAAPGAAAVKFTTTDDVFERCPRGTPCLVCDIDVPFRLVTEPAVLDAAGTDTERLGAAGARPVVWAIARKSAVAAAWNAVRARLPEAALVVLEGSTIVETARPALELFVTHPFLSPERWKDGSARRVARADAVVVNRPSAESRAPAPAVLETLRGWRGRDDIRVADVTRPLSEWAPELAGRLWALRPGLVEA